MAKRRVDLASADISSGRFTDVRQRGAERALEQALDHLKKVKASARPESADREPATMQFPDQNFALQPNCGTWVRALVKSSSVSAPLE